MEPTWTSDCGTVKLWLGDCLEVMATWPDGSVDAVVVDPPYLNLRGGYSYSDLGGVAQRVEESISVGDPWEASMGWAKDAARVLKYGAIVFCTYHGLPETALAFSEMRRAVLWSWHKRNAPAPGKNVPRFTEEYAWGFAKQPGLKWDAIRSTLIDIPKLSTGCCVNGERVVDEFGRAKHPTQKPIAVMLRLLSVTRHGMIAADPFMGSGTTGVAAVRLGRQFWGVEIDPEYFAIAKRRIQDELNRFPLFEPPKPRQKELLT